MTIPTERTRALVYAHLFLKDLLNPAVTPRVSREVRETAKWLLRHYPELSTVQYAHRLCPELFGPVPEQMDSLSYAPREKPGAKK